MAWHTLCSVYISPVIHDWKRRWNRMIAMRCNEAQKCWWMGWPKKRKCGGLGYGYQKHRTPKSCPYLVIRVIFFFTGHLHLVTQWWLANETARRFLFPTFASIADIDRSDKDGDPSKIEKKHNKWITHDFHSLVKNDSSGKRIYCNWCSENWCILHCF
jgi:hypothetical protein